MINLSPRQSDAYKIIVNYWIENGEPPSLRHVATEMGITLTAVQCHVEAMKRKGALEEKPKLYPEGMEDHIKRFPVG